MSPTFVAAPAPRAARSFFSADAATLAVRLLGQGLVCIHDDGTRLSGVIVETEAYLGVHDRASHAWNGRRTPRNEAMYAAPGTAYVYFTYGMHFCFNVVCGRTDEPAAVLIRSLAPVEGLDAMHVRRENAPRPARPLRDTDLCSGPGKLCRALGIDRQLNGADLTRDRRVFVERLRRGPLDVELIGTGPRIGVGSAGRWAAEPLRWFVKDCPHVSR